MKKLLPLLFITLMLAGCATTIDTANMGPEDRLNYAIGIYNDEDWLEALKEFEAIVLQYPGNSIADDAQFYLGKTRYERDEYILAAFEFSKLISNMPASELVPQSQYMLADCYYQLSPDYSLDQRYTKKAIEEYQSFIDFFPTNEKVKEAESRIGELNDKLAYKEYHNAYIYEKLEYYTAALMYYNNVIEVYHDTKYAPLAMYNRINILILRDKNKEALDEAEKFLSEYPNHSNYSAVDKIRKNLLGKV